jgi:Cu2+-exporting ATPase
MSAAAFAAPSGYAVWTSENGERARAVFAAQGIRCAACSRAVEKQVRTVAGVQRVEVNVATARICVEWAPDRAGLAEILGAVARAGFKALPLAGEAAQERFRRERRAALKRTGLAGLGMMQVMMYVLGVYIAEPGDIDAGTASYLRIVAMIITTPVLLYSGSPFLLGALRDLRRLSLGMDVPVAIALVLAYAASVFNTLRGTGETYFDSVTMFIFFLGAGRYAELVVRQRRLSAAEALGRSLPASVIRSHADGSTERVPVDQVAPGDRLSIPKGAVVPVDSELASDRALIDESLVSGEFQPLRRGTGEFVPGGAVNAGDAIRVVVRRVAAESTLASIVALLERAQAERPPAARIADRTAAGFIGAILLLAVAVALAWLAVDATRAFPAALAVLVVTCPCALSLATPAAVAAASTRLARLGLLVTRAHALEQLASIDTVVLDKTGTLTSGGSSLQLAQMRDGMTRERALAIAAALERASEHPLAAAFAPYADESVRAQGISETPGHGIEGDVEGERWRLGRPGYVSGLQSGGACPEGDALSLGSRRGIEATFDVSEAARPDVREALTGLRSLGVEPAIASGDRVVAVEALARELCIERAAGRLDPAQKMAFVQNLQQRGRRVLMIGDGVNDGPVLATAAVSCAMGQGSAVAHAAADLMLLSDSLCALPRGIAVARRMQAAIRRNLRWALAYNFSAVPLAALGWIPPWLAAIGMSASSLLVVLNSARLARD